MTTVVNDDTRIDIGVGKARRRLRRAEIARNEAIKASRMATHELNRLRQAGVKGHGLSSAASAKRQANSAYNQAMDEIKRIKLYYPQLN